MGTVTKANMPLYYPYQSAGFSFTGLSSYAWQNKGILKTTTHSSLITPAPSASTASRTTTLTLNKHKSTLVNYSPTLL